MCFAQFEREVSGERIRDKIAASKKKGIWMGGTVPLGYDWWERRLVVNEAEAATVRLMFEQYIELRSVRLLKEELTRDGVVSKVRVSSKGNRSGGQPFGRGALYELLANPIYLGEIRHRKVRHPGQHLAIVDRPASAKKERSKVIVSFGFAIYFRPARRDRGNIRAKTMGCRYRKLDPPPSLRCQRFSAKIAEITALRREFASPAAPEIAKRNVLAATCEIGKTDCFVVQHFVERWRHSIQARELTAIFEPLGW